MGSHARGGLPKDCLLPSSLAVRVRAGGSKQTKVAGGRATGRGAAGEHCLLNALQKTCALGHMEREHVQASHGRSLVSVLRTSEFLSGYEADRGGWPFLNSRPMVNTLACVLTCNDAHVQDDTHKCMRMRAHTRAHTHTRLRD